MSCLACPWPNKCTCMTTPPTRTPFHLWPTCPQTQLNDLTHASHEHTEDQMVKERLLLRNYSTDMQAFLPTLTYTQAPHSAYTRILPEQRHLFWGSQQKENNLASATAKKNVQRCPQGYTISTSWHSGKKMVILWEWKDATRFCTSMWM